MSHSGFNLAYNLPSVFDCALLTHLDVGVLRAYVSIGQIWKVLEIQDERFGLLLRLGLRENADRAVLGVGPPPLVAVGLRQETLDLVLLLQSLRDILDPTAMNQVAMSLQTTNASCEIKS